MLFGRLIIAIAVVNRNVIYAPAFLAMAMRLIVRPAPLASSCQRRSRTSSAASLASSFFSGWRSRPETIPATSSQRDGSEEIDPSEVLEFVSGEIGPLQPKVVVIPTRSASPASDPLAACPSAGGHQ
jgi:hypothetical protein